MSWDAAGAIGEIVGALAVVISLLYLSGQVRQTNRQASNTSLQTVLQSEMNFAAIILENAEIWDKLNVGDPLSGREETRKGIILFNLYLLDSASRYNQYKTGYLEVENWECREQTLHNLVQWPIFELWRDSLGAKGHGKEFLGIIDSFRASYLESKV